ncbi:protogenin-like [Lacerta agilis]|uniref:protogenin-like n=1 Tax=Lacerta agilis TaxID=80427 RepID=UPI001419B7DA|nr:protogenin-like [Lacerta agilis]
MGANEVGKSIEDLAENEESLQPMMVGSSFLDAKTQRRFTKRSVYVSVGHGPSSFAKMPPQSKSRTTRLRTASLLTTEHSANSEESHETGDSEGSLMSPMKNFTSLRRQCYSSDPRFLCRQCPCVSAPECL